MSKIYNEIIIDMNPESPSFEKVIYEDSFEYSGDMILMQDNIITAGSFEKWYTWDTPDGKASGKTAPAETSSAGNIKSELRYKEYVWNDETKTYDATGTQTTDTSNYFPTLADANASMNAVFQRGTTSEWGTPNITKDMFIDTATNMPKTVEEIYRTLDPILTGITGPDLINYIHDMLPQYGGVSVEETGFLEEERAEAEGIAGTKREADVYGLQKEAGEVAGATRSVYGGMGAGARGAMGAQAGIKKGLGAADDAYTLALQQAERTERKGIYDLTTKAAGKFETDIAGAIGEMETPFATSGSGTLTTEYGSFRKGGKVPDREETFLDLLTQLPDAGGT